MENLRLRKRHFSRALANRRPILGVVFCLLYLPVLGSPDNNHEMTPSDTGRTKKDSVYINTVYYGRQLKHNVTGAFSQINGQPIENNPVVNNENRVQGLLPGLFVMQNNGEPGDEGASMLIRGKRTFRNNAPVVLVDGYERAMDQLDPNEIETITVLKDAAATAQYGLKGGNGIILVTTKRGQEGKIRVSLNARARFIMKRSPTTALLQNTMPQTLVNMRKPHREFMKVTWTAISILISTGMSNT
jgi:TonB-dependent SusC/RagA subfamily outer membrane receptor